MRTTENPAFPKSHIQMTSAASAAGTLLKNFSCYVGQQIRILVEYELKQINPKSFLTFIVIQAQADHWS